MIKKAIDFAKEKHKNQQRKYTGEPYFVHLKEVADLVQNAAQGTQDMIVAAYLHDCAEDQNVSFEEIRMLFGDKVASLVEELTDISRPIDGDRKTRKQIDLQHTAKASPEGKTIKLADIISNVGSIAERDPDFAKIYLKEKELLLEVLSEGNAILFKQADELIRKNRLKIF